MSYIRLILSNLGDVILSEVPEIIKKLVNKFDHNLAAYKSSDYKEEQLKQEFINPFFKALGWDVDNESDAAPQYRDVIFEDSIKVGGGTKAPDYCFTLAGRRMFFVEAKKPSVNINEGIEPSYQLRRYTWSAKLHLSILTDFEEFAIYESRTKPKKNDRASTGRITYLTYKDYVEKWDEIYNIFSKEAVLKGSFDLYADSTINKRGTSAVDDAFLSEIESWRELFAKNIALRNPEISIAELNYSVQQIIDRIVFLRMCEDRGAERYEQLRDLLNNDNIYEQFCELCKDADAKYNSGLFHFKEEKGRETPPDKHTLDLTIDDGVFKTVIKNLYYPNSPYEFSVLSPEILGNVYEQFLGKVIRLTKGHQAKVEEKPEVKKAGGVYYTPQFVVDYIVENTVGKLVKGKTPNKVSELKILDPACGSGSFLLGAYNYLIKWHRDYYSNQNDKNRLKDKIYKGKDDEWFLTITEKKRILLNNIYGVDIDTQAVEVTKLSLLLKVIEGENKDALEAQQKLFRERVLPDLENNIKCGNSLIGPEIYDEEIEGIENVNFFDWDSNFSKIMNNGGFDAVIGNPPYIRIQAMKEWAPIEVEFYKKKYISASIGNYDIYVVFVERVIELLNENGLLGFILPHKFFKKEYGKPLRSIIASGSYLSKVVNFGCQQVFPKATTYTCLLFLDKSRENKKFDYLKVDDLNKWIIEQKSIQGKISSNKVTMEEWNFVVEPYVDLYDKLSKIPLRLGDTTNIFVGLQTSADKVFIMDLIEETPDYLHLYSKILKREVKLEKELLFPLLSGTDVNRYSKLPKRQYIIFPYTINNGKAELIDFKIISEKYPKIAEYFSQNKKILQEREKGKLKDKPWHGYIYQKNMAKQSLKKLCVPRLVENLYGSYDIKGDHYLDNVDVGGLTLKGDYVNLELEYILSILNSKLMRWYFPFITEPFRGCWWSANKQYLSKLPMRNINFNDLNDVTIHSKIIELVDKMFKLKENLDNTKFPQENERIQRQIDATDKQIDQMVYDLYGLTPEEIKIIEDSL
jgi:type I restriction-modification system DNA methylase subunit